MRRRRTREPGKIYDRRLSTARKIAKHNFFPCQQHAYFSAPTTPSDKEADAAFGQRYLPKEATSQSSGGGRRNSGCSDAKPASPPVKAANAAMSASRSRLVQELLEQNSAVLQKLKERSETGGQLAPANGETAPAERAASPCHNPFPRQLVRPPSEVTVKLKMYESTQKY